MSYYAAFSVVNQEKETENINIYVNQGLFKINKYSTWYFKIINNALSRQNQQIVGEKHHIIPKCMGGVEVVKLTNREHYICHLLLPKIVISPIHVMKMHYALWLIVNCTHKVNSKVYERIRLIAVEQMKINGRKKSPEAILSMRMSRLGKKRSQSTIESMRKKCNPPSRKGVKYSVDDRHKIKFLKKANKIIKSFCPLFVKTKIKDLS